eukprot:Nk52_evm6s2152 gene=Nk52_evmTU6s2152
MGKTFKKNHKGKAKVYTAGPIEEDENKQKKQAFNKWREPSESESEESDVEQPQVTAGDSAEEDSGSDIDSPPIVIAGRKNNQAGMQQKQKQQQASPAGIRSTNPNRDPRAEPRGLSRREKEELAKQQARQRYEKMHREGKTDEAKADLARLAVIRKQREEAAKKREAEKKAKEEAAKAKAAAQKARQKTQPFATYGDGGMKNRKKEGEKEEEHDSYVCMPVENVKGKVDCPPCLGKEGEKGGIFAYVCMWRL